MVGSCGQFQLFFVEEMPPWPFAWPSAGVAIAGEWPFCRFVAGAFSPVLSVVAPHPSLSHEIKKMPNNLCSMKSSPVKKINQLTISNNSTISPW